MKISREAQKLEHLLGREPTVSEISKAAGLSVEEVSEAICVMQPVVSLTRETDDGDEIMDIPVDATAASTIASNFFIFVYSFLLYCFTVLKYYDCIILYRFKFVKCFC